jgi:hypothetical protein
MAMTNSRPSLERDKCCSSCFFADPGDHMGVGWLSMVGEHYLRPSFDLGFGV